ncbi:MAG: TonB-dependent receptor plug domain-containing protein [Rhodothermaceae bacterium]|nr:TonB-dependent receptor plug domain-containing protein [Rhodothermaceae bacterium]
MRAIHGNNFLFLASFLLFVLAMSGCKTTTQSEKSEISELSDQLNADNNEATYPSSSHTAFDLLKEYIPGVDVTEVEGGGIRIDIIGRDHNRDDSPPLYVVNGTPAETKDGILYDLDPDDISSISVLKDVASTSAYGRRGANGVVVIKTRTGGE